MCEIYHFYKMTFLNCFTKTDTNQIEKPRYQLCSLKFPTKLALEKALFAVTIYIDMDLTFVSNSMLSISTLYGLT